MARSGGAAQAGAHIEYSHVWLQRCVCGCGHHLLPQSHAPPAFPPGDAPLIHPQSPIYTQDTPRINAFERNWKAGRPEGFCMMELFSAC